MLRGAPRGYSREVEPQPRLEFFSEGAATQRISFLQRISLRCVKHMCSFRAILPSIEVDFQLKNLLALSGHRTEEGFWKSTTRQVGEAAVGQRRLRPGIRPKGPVSKPPNTWRRRLMTAGFMLLLRCNCDSQPQSRLYLWFGFPNHIGSKK